MRAGTFTHGLRATYARGVGLPALPPSVWSWGSTMYVKAGTVPVDTWALKRCLKQSNRDSVLGGEPAGGDGSVTGFCVIPLRKMNASLG